MPSILDVAGRRFQSFESLPFDVLDAALFTQIVSIDCASVVPSLHSRADFHDEQTVLDDRVVNDSAPVTFKDMLQAPHFSEMFPDGSFGPKEQILMLLASNPRYADVQISDYLSLLDVNRVAQFAAMTFQVGETGVIAFRGTDNTVTGWREDFDMGFKAPVPAQRHATMYLSKVVDRLPEKLIVIGHSKGGNLAEYATLTTTPEIQDRIQFVYNLDGPGFKEGVFTKEDYAPVIDRMAKYLPQDSMVGILLYSPLHRRVVKSNAKGFAGHSVRTWEVEEDLLSFVELPSLSDRSMMLETTLDRWIASYNDAEREMLVDSLFSLVAHSGGHDLDSVVSGSARIVMDYVEGRSVFAEHDVVNIIRAAKDFLDTAAALTISRIEAEHADEEKLPKSIEDA